VNRARREDLRRRGRRRSSRCAIGSPTAASSPYVTRSADSADARARARRPRVRFKKGTRARSPAPRGPHRRVRARSQRARSRGMLEAYARYLLLTSFRRPGRAKGSRARPKGRRQGAHGRTLAPARRRARPRAATSEATFLDRAEALVAKGGATRSSERRSRRRLARARRPRQELGANFRDAIPHVRPRAGAKDPDNVRATLGARRALRRGEPQGDRPRAAGTRPLAPARSRSRSSARRVLARGHEPHERGRGASKSATPQLRFDDPQIAQGKLDRWPSHGATRRPPRGTGSNDSSCSANPDSARSFGSRRARVRRQLGDRPKAIASYKADASSSPPRTPTRCARSPNVYAVGGNTRGAAPPAP
jgi:hypothetical protein